MTIEEAVKVIDKFISSGETEEMNEAVNVILNTTEHREDVRDLDRMAKVCSVVISVGLLDMGLTENQLHKVLVTCQAASVLGATLYPCFNEI